MIQNQKVGQETTIEGISDQSLVVIQQRVRSPSPTATVTGGGPMKPINAATARRKRRSMSVSDVEVAKTLVPNLPPIRRSGEAKRSQDSFLNGVMTDFRGELSQLDPVSAKSLDLQDPTTAGRRPLIGRSRSDNSSQSSSRHGERPPPKISASLPPVSTTTPAVTLQSTTGAEQSLLDAVLASPTSATTQSEGHGIPRTPSVHSQARARSGSGNSGQQRISGLRHGPRSPLGKNGLGHVSSPSRETNRLRVQHRSTASSSEPSLIPNRDDGGRVRECIHNVYCFALTWVC